MTYALRAVTVALCTFALVYALVWAVVVCWWPVARRVTRGIAKPTLATLLFALQLAPLACATLAVACLAVPSFLRFEPHAVDEALGAAPIALALAAILLVGSGLARVLRSWARTAAVATRWCGDTCSHCGVPPIPLYHANAEGILAVTGVTRPKLFLSADVAGSLTAHELERAVAHEMVHVRRRDNLAKLLVLFCPMPGTQEMENAWLEALEMTADERAVRSREEALELASALVKVSRLRRHQLPELATGFAAAAPGALAARIERLLAWHQDQQHRGGASTAFVAAMLAPALGVALMYHPILLQVHAFTEWLVR